jgi:hypothetical protein
LGQREKKGRWAALARRREWAREDRFRGLGFYFEKLSPF